MRCEHSKGAYNRTHTIARETGGPAATGAQRAESSACGALRYPRGGGAGGAVRAVRTGKARLLAHVTVLLLILIAFGSVPVAARSGYVLSTDYSHSCLARADGLFCFGRGTDGRLGTGSVSHVGVSGGQVAALSPIGGLEAFSTPAVGGEHTCALEPDGDVFCFGKNDVGQLGKTASGISATATTRVDLDAAVLQIELGVAHACARLSTGGVRCWGDGSNGQLGSSAAYIDTLGGSTDIVFENDEAVIDLGAGDRHNCALFADGAVRCWGDNSSGQCGQETTASDIGTSAAEMATLPRVPFADDMAAVKRVYAGGDHSCVLTVDNAVKCWGDNTDNVLGYEGPTSVGAADADMADELRPVAFGRTERVLGLSSANQSICALLNDQILCYGNGGSGRLGQESTDTIGSDAKPIDAYEPIDFGADGVRAVGVGMGNDFACGLFLADDASGPEKVKCWGDSNSGKLGLGPTPDLGDDASEMASISFVTFPTDPAIPAGEVYCAGDVIASLADWAALVVRPGCTTMTSSLTLAVIDAVSLPPSRVVTIKGALVIQSSSLATVHEAFPDLQEVTSTLTVNSGARALTDLDLPALTVVGAEVSLVNVPVLARVSLPALTSARALLVRDMDSLAHLSLDALTSLSGEVQQLSMAIADNSALAYIDIARLESIAGDTAVERCPLLRRLAIGSSEDVSSFSAGHVVIEDVGASAPLGGFGDNFRGGALNTVTLDNVNVDGPLVMDYSSVSSVTVSGTSTVATISLEAMSGDPSLILTDLATLKQASITGISLGTIQASNCVSLEALYIVDASSVISIDLQDNAVLTSIVADSLSSISTLTLDNNAALCCNDKDALVSAATGTSGDLLCSSGDDACASCPAGSAGASCEICADVCASRVCTNDGSRIEAEAICTADCLAERTFLGDRLDEAIHIPNTATVGSLTTESTQFVASAPMCTSVSHAGRVHVTDADLLTCDGFSWNSASLSPVVSPSLHAKDVVAHAAIGPLSKRGFHAATVTDGVQVVGRIGDLNDDDVPDVAVLLEPFVLGFIFLASEGSVRAVARVDTDLPPAVLMGMGETPTVVPVGDQNGDGVGDLVLTVPGLSSLAVLFMAGHGRVHSHAIIAPPDGLSSDSGFGGSVGECGDVNGDGTVDIVAGAPGDRVAVVMLLSPTHPGTVLASVSLEAPVASVSFGNAVAGLGDVNGDGVPDIAVGGTDVVFVAFLASDGSATSSPSALAAPGYASLAAAGDLDGDGVPDIALGLSSPSSGGYALILLSSDGAEKHRETTMHTDLASDATSQSALGATIAVVGDIDQNGAADIVVSAPSMHAGQGRWYVVLNQAGETACGNGAVEAGESCDDGNLDAADGCSPVCTLEPIDTFTFASQYDDTTDGATLNPGASLALSTWICNPDVNGDGICDLAVATSSTTDGFVLIFLMNEDGTPDGAPIKIERTDVGESSSNFVDGLTAYGDANGDGVGDIVVGVEGAGANSGGAIYVVFLAPSGGVLGTGPVIDTATGPLAPFAGHSTSFGRTVDAVGDLNGDGITDLVVTVYLVTCPVETSSQCGAAYVLFMTAELTASSVQVLQQSSGGFPDDFPEADKALFSAFPVGDVNLDGIPDIAFGSLGGRFLLAAMNADGTVQSHVVIEAPSELLSPFFGLSVSGALDLDGDGVQDLLVGASRAGINQQGALVRVLLNRDLTIKAMDEIALPDTTRRSEAHFARSVQVTSNFSGKGDIAMAATSYTDSTDDAGAGAFRVYMLSSSGCGNGLVEHGEECDDGNAVNGDMCSSACTANLVTGVHSAHRVDMRVSDLRESIADSTSAGTAVAGLSHPDVNGDGVADVAVGTNAGHVLLLFMHGEAVSAATTLRIEPQMLEGTESGAGFGASLASLGDWDGDGVHDIIVGQSNGASGGAVHVVLLSAHGRVSSFLSILDNGSSDVFDELTPLTFGQSVAAIGDMDGDGLTDIAVGDDSASDGAGLVHLIGITRNADDDLVAHAIAHLSGNSGDELDVHNLGRVMAAAGDIDGNGVSDLLVSTKSSSSSTRTSIHILFLDQSSVQSWAQIDVSAAGPAGAAMDDVRGFTGMGDLDGDSVPDVAVHIGSSDHEDLSTYLIHLATDGHVLRSTRLSVTLRSREGDNSFFGASLGRASDLNGDGIVDLLIGSPLDDRDANNGGAMFAYLLATAGRCGDGVVDSGEACDDGNLDETDGCSTMCLGNAMTGVERVVLLSSEQNGLGTIPDGAQLGWGLASICNPDVNGDGICDIASGRWVGGVKDVYVFLMNSDGTVLSQSEIDGNTIAGSSSSFGANVCGIGDFDGDGIGDIAIADYDSGDGGFVIVTLNADGTKKDAGSLLKGGSANFPTTFHSYNLVQTLNSAGDVNGDGIPDVMFGSSANDGDEGEAFILFMKADKTILKHTALKSTVGPTADKFGYHLTSLGDLNGDGTPDIAVLTNGGLLEVLLLNQDGTISSAAVVNGIMPSTSFRGMTAADMNGDGVPDIVMGSTEKGGILTYYLTRSGDLLAVGPEFTASSQRLLKIATGSSSGAVAALGDLNGDGIAEIASGMRWYNLPATETGGIAIIMSSTSGCGNGVLESGEFCDDGNVLDGDGCSSTCHVDSADGIAGVVMLTDDTNNAGSLPAGAKFGAKVAALVEPDVNGDGVGDLAVGSETQGLHVCMLGTDGVPLAECTVTGPGDFPDLTDGGAWVEALGDWDADGVADVIVAGTDIGGGSSGGFQVALLSSSGNVAALGPNVWHALHSQVAVIGDVNGDGRPDVAAGDIHFDCTDGSDCGSMEIIFLATDMGEQSRTSLTLDTNGMPDNFPLATAAFGLGFAVGDVNGDGVPDVGYAGRESGNEQFGVLFLKPNGQVKSASVFAEPSSGFVTSIAGDEYALGMCSAGDVDGNGVPDIILSAHARNSGAGGYAVAYLAADGTVARFRYVTQDDDAAFATGASGFGRSCALLGDVNGDGFPDLAVSAFEHDATGSDNGAVFVLLQNSADTCGNGVVDDGEACDRGQNTADATCTDECSARVLAGVRDRTWLTSGRNGMGDYEYVSYVGSTVLGLYDPDVNGDGIPDLLYHVYAADQIFLAMLNSDGTVAEHIPLDLSALGPSAGHSAGKMGDFNEDGVQDIVVGASSFGTNGGAAHVVQLKKDGSVNLVSDPIEVAGASQFGRGCSGIGDLNNDGFLDFAAADATDTSCAAGTCGAVHIIFLKQGMAVYDTVKITEGSGGFSDTLLAGMDFGLYASENIGDVNGDGVDDLVIGSPGANPDGLAPLGDGMIHVLLMDASGTVASDTGIRPVRVDNDVFGFGLGLAAAGDQNGDGVPDVLVSGYTGVFLVLLDATGAALSQSPVSPNTDPVGSACGRDLAVLGDVNGDRVLDMAIGCQLIDVDRGGIAIVHGSTSTCGNGVLDDGEECDDGNVRAGDFCSPICTREPLNKIGSTRKINNVDLTLADGGGGFLRMDTISGPDIDGDEITDVVVGVWSAYALTIILNVDGSVKSHGKIGMGQVSGSPTNKFGYPTCAAKMNVDPGTSSTGDIVIADYEANSFWIVRLNSDGTFAGSGPQAGPSTSTAMAGYVPGYWYFIDSLGDMNGDGYVDLIVTDAHSDAGGLCSSCGALLVIFTNSAYDVGSYVALTRGTVGFPAGFPADSNPFPNSAYVLDDSDSDSVLLSAAAQAIRISRSSAEVLLFESSPRASTGPLQVDVDGDGLLDMYSTNYADDFLKFQLSSDATGEQPYVHEYMLEDGVLGFSAEMGFVRPLGDLNGDGFPDFAGNYFWDDENGAPKGAVAIMFGDSSRCGDGIVEVFEACDDGNYDDTDSCTTECTLNRPDTFVSAVEFGNGGADVGTADALEGLGASVAGLYDPDVDGDGFPDVAVAGAGSLRVVAMAASGAVKHVAHHFYRDGVFSDAPRPLDGSSLKLDSFGDANDDGVHDLLVGDSALGSNGGVLAVFLASDGTIQRTVSYLPGTTPGLRAAEGSSFGSDVAYVGDVDGNRWPDFAVADAASGAVTLVRTTFDFGVLSSIAFDGSSDDLLHPFGAGGLLSIAGAGDVNGDGVADLAVVSSASSSVHVLFLDSSMDVTSDVRSIVDSGVGKSLANLNGSGRGNGAVGVLAGVDDGATTYHFDASGQVVSSAATVATGGAFSPEASAACGASVSAAGVIGSDDVIDVWIGCPADYADDSGSLWAIDLGSSLCGNKVVDAGEQCDDGNLVSGDGCSASCTTDELCDSINGGASICFIADEVRRNGVLHGNKINPHRGPSFDSTVAYAHRGQARGHMCLDIGSAPLDSDTVPNLFSSATSGATIVAALHFNTIPTSTQFLLNFPSPTTDGHFEFGWEVLSSGWTEMSVQQGSNKGRRSMAGLAGIPTQTGVDGVAVYSWTIHSDNSVTMRAAVDGGPMKTLFNRRLDAGDLTAAQFFTGGYKVSIGARRSGNLGGWPTLPAHDGLSDLCLYELHTYANALSDSDLRLVEDSMRDRYFPVVPDGLCGDGIVEGREGCDPGPGDADGECDAYCEPAWGCSPWEVDSVKEVDLGIAMIVSRAGDVNGDGVPDFFSMSGSQGKVYTILLNADGTKKARTTIGENLGGFTGTWAGGTVSGTICLLGRVTDTHLTDILVRSSTTFYPLSIGTDGLVVKQHAPFTTGHSVLSAVPALDSPADASSPRGVQDSVTGRVYTGIGGPDDIAEFVIADGTDHCIYIVSLDATLQPSDRKVLCKADADAAGYSAKWPAVSGTTFKAVVIGDVDGNGVADVHFFLRFDSGSGSAPTGTLVFLSDTGDIVHMAKLDFGNGVTETPNIVDTWFGAAAVMLPPPANEDNGRSHLVLTAQNQHSSVAFGGVVHHLCADREGTVHQHRRNTLGSMGALLPDVTELGETMCRLGDVNGDGVDDIAISNEENNEYVIMFMKRRD